MVIYVFFFQCTDVNKNQLNYKKTQIENKDIVYIWNNFLLYTNKYLLLYIFINEAGIMYRYFFVFFIKMYRFE